MKPRIVRRTDDAYTIEALKNKLSEERKSFINFYLENIGDSLTYQRFLYQVNYLEELPVELKDIIKQYLAIGCECEPFQRCDKCDK